MVKLAAQFNGRGSQKGWQFDLMERQGDVAIYKKSSESIVYYEVIMVKVRKAKSVLMAGVMVDFQESEAYPGDEQFGNYGWTYGNLDAAKVKFEDLVQKATYLASFGPESNAHVLL